MQIEHVNFLGQVSTIMSALTSKDGDLLSHFDNTNEKNTLADFNSVPFKQMLIDKYIKPPKKVKSKVTFPKNIYSDFVKQLKRLLKTWDFI